SRGSRARCDRASNVVWSLPRPSGREAPDPEEPVEHQEQDRGDDEQYERGRGRRTPLEDVDPGLDEGRHGEDGSSSEDPGGREVSEREDEDEDAPREDARGRERRVDPREHLESGCPET